MAFVYYQDSSVLDKPGVRFSRAAVLILPNWLLTASLERNDAPLAFPQKTLLARLGAVNIDSNFNFNEDEEEQEREVIQVVQPYNFSAQQWWFSDITLLKTLQPFNTTSIVAPTTPRYKQEVNVKACKMLIYARRYGNATEDKVLMQISTELLLPTTDCGFHFQSSTMICGADSDDNKNFIYDSEYCQGNSGGPLLCEGEVTGLQTYINDNCEQPHLFQFLSAWEKFITCGVEEKCHEGQCNTTCVTINKDTPINEIVIPTNNETKVILVSQSVQEDSFTATETSLVMSTQTTEKNSDESGKTPPTLTTVIEEQTTTENITTVTDNFIASKIDEDQTTTLTSIKIKENPKDFEQTEDADNIERKTTVEAQQQMIITKKNFANEMHSSQILILCLLIILNTISRWIV
ncbi:unnamed protein product [Parnassius apollo]|uniref:(apollo) hypothetical protein n=1 Tax=Parnassius apollo TaxID=110799 RepID=A0A8S3YCV9_PARAO|nr:unnamed protein product [Parnassius apollo]